uniref:BZIP domain-containing protein n=1 Tax=Steinernema glaseri TaxID=37863 RepID=A0A1I8A2E2_9BILA
MDTVPSVTSYLTSTRVFFRPWNLRRTGSYLLGDVNSTVIFSQNRPKVANKTQRCKCAPDLASRISLSREAFSAFGCVVGSGRSRPLSALPEFGVWQNNASSDRRAVRRVRSFAPSPCSRQAPRRVVRTVFAHPARLLPGRPFATRLRVKIDPCSSNRFDRRSKDRTLRSSEPNREGCKALYCTLSSATLLLIDYAFFMSPVPSSCAFAINHSRASRYRTPPTHIFSVEHTMSSNKNQLSELQIRLLAETSSQAGRVLPNHPQPQRHPRTDLSEFSADERAEKRKENNRRASRASRERIKSEVTLLRQALKQSLQEIDELRKEVSELRITGDNLQKSYLESVAQLQYTCTLYSQALSPPPTSPPMCQNLYSLYRLERSHRCDSESVTERSVNNNQSQCTGQWDDTAEKPGSITVTVDSSYRNPETSLPRQIKNNDLY